VFEGVNVKSKRQLSRRDFLKVTAVLGADAFVLGLAGTGYARNIEPAWVEVTDVRLKLPRLAGSFSGFRMVQISDIHLGYWMTIERLESLMPLIMEQAPDLIAFTGDFVYASRYSSTSRNQLDDAIAVLTKLTERFPVVAVLGNHEYWYDAQAVQQMLEDSKVTVLKNSVFTLDRSGEMFHIAGVDDIYENQDDLDAVLEKLPNDGCAVLLAHEPDFADQSAATGRFDLQISGHTHGGQVVLPFIGPPILPYLGTRYPSGLYRVGEMYQYTNRGVGMTNPRVRLNCRPEITVFTLESN
jgi:predicted MPP superfamily phosphohydrolase